MRSIEPGTRSSGLSVVVLEARDRIGGRLRTEAGLDLGATWYWPSEERIQALVRELGLATFPQHLAGDAILQTADGLTRLDGNAIDTPSGRFVGGADCLAQAVFRQLPEGTVRLRHPVHEMRSQAEGLTVLTSEEVFVGRHVVLAIPPALASEQITFSPPLPDRLARRAAATPVWMGATSKVVASYSEPFWRRITSSATWSTLQPRRVNASTGPPRKPPPSTPDTSKAPFAALNEPSGPF